MHINKNNYQAWFLDYAEGNLNNNQKNELMLFLKMNPELKAEFEEFELIKLENTNTKKLPEGIKSFLKKSNVHINEDNIGEFIVKQLEGILTIDESISLEKYLQENPEKKKLVSYYALAKLQKQHFEYEDKLIIKQHSTISADNVDYYIMSNKEGLLSKDEADSLKKLINKNKTLQKLEALYTQTYLSKNEIYVYKKKHLLKKKETGLIYYMWRYGIAAAACVALYFLVFKADNDINKPYTSSVLAEKSVKSILNKTQIKKNADNKPYNNQQNNYTANTMHDNKTKQSNNNTITQIKIHDTANTILIKQPIITNDYAIENEKGEENNYPLMAEEKNIHTNKELQTEKNNDIYLTPIEYANKSIRKKYFSPDSESTEPIKSNELFSAFSDGITKITNNYVKVQNNTDNMKKGFSLSIGKFEISRSINK